MEREMAVKEKTAQEVKGAEVTNPVSPDLATDPMAAALHTKRPGLVEGHTYPLLLPPDDVTRNVRAIRLKEKIETIGDVAGITNFERRPRNGNAAD